MSIKLPYTQCLPTTDVLKNSAVAVFDTTLSSGTQKVRTGLRILSANSFNCEPLSIDGHPTDKDGTIAIECIYKNAIGDLKMQQSVSGLIYTDIPSATMAFLDSGTEQSKIYLLASGTWGGNYLRAVWTASGAGTGYLSINIA